VRCTFAPAQTMDVIFMVVYGNGKTGVGCIASFLERLILIGNE
jgi:hypothetical protein